MVDLLLGGDFYAPRGFHPVVSQPLRELIGGATHSFVNLEGPTTDADERIAKSGPTIVSSPDSMQALSRMGWTGVVSANNHIMDAGERGLLDTLDLCQEHGLHQVGAFHPGHPLGATSAVDLPLSDDSAVRLLAFCEREWSVTSRPYGASGWSVVEAARQLVEARAEGLRVVVILHGGNEYFPLPRPRLRNELRYLAEVGADAIVMHHNHVPSAFEVWHGTPICYGLGNFQFAMPSPRGEWYEGLLAGLTFGSNGVDLELTPISMSPEFHVDVAQSPLREAILNQVGGHGIQAMSDEALQVLWRGFATEIGAGLLAASLPGRWPGPKRLENVLNRAALRRWEEDPERLMTLTNVFRCDSLAEAVETYLWRHFEE